MNKRKLINRLLLICAVVVVLVYTLIFYLIGSIWLGILISLACCFSFYRGMHLVRHTLNTYAMERSEKIIKLAAGFFWMAVSVFILVYLFIFFALPFMNI